MLCYDDGFLLFVCILVWLFVDLLDWLAYCCLDGWFVVVDIWIWILWFVRYLVDLFVCYYRVFASWFGFGYCLFYSLVDDLFLIIGCMLLLGLLGFIVVYVFFVCSLLVCWLVWVWMYCDYLRVCGLCLFGFFNWFNSVGLVVYFKVIIYYYWLRWFRCGVS